MKRWISLLGILAMLAVGAPAVSAAKAPESDSQLAMSSGRSMGLDGQWSQYIRGKVTVATGVADIPWRFVFSDRRTGEDLDSFLLLDARPRTEEMDSFFTRWPDTTAYIEEQARAAYGDVLRDIRFGRAGKDAGDEVYIVRLWLRGEEREMEVTCCYQFRRSWYGFTMGVNRGDMPEMYELAKQSALTFRDRTGAPGTAVQSIYSTGAYRGGPGPWQWPVINLLDVLGEFTYRGYDNYNPNTGA